MMDITTNFVDNIKACRTCGIHYVTPSKNQLKHLFQSCQEHSDIMLIRLELSQWNIEVAENDGFPQYVCNTCVHKFEQVFQLRTACINAQNEFRKFYALPNGIAPNTKIKSEIPDIDEEPICDFIYVDDLSDGEYDGATPFNIPHMPIKEEFIEAATIPMDDSEQPSKIIELASRDAMPLNTSCSLATEYIPQVVLPMLDTVECNICRQICASQDEHKHHMENEHDIKDEECHICGKEFKNCTSARFKFHLKWHTLNKQVKCNFCNFVCKSKDALNVHKRAKHNKLNCKICGKVVLAKKIKIHMKQHQIQQQYACEYCAKAFSTENDRETHIWQIHANEDNSVNCSSIDFQTNYIPTDNEVSLNMEQEKCQQTVGNVLYKFICAYCEHRFVDQIDLETHVRQEHRGAEFKPFEPETILEATQPDDTNVVQNLLNRNEHIVFEKYDSDNENDLADSNNPSINSAILKQDFLTPTPSGLANQNENMQKDETEIISSSSFNEDSATSESNNISSYVGDNLNRFACAKCTETFQSIEQLREHHDIHLSTENQELKTNPTNSKFQCTICGKKFNLNVRLNRHINKHKKDTTC